MNKIFHLATDLSHPLPFQNEGWLYIAWLLYFASKYHFRCYFKTVKTKLLLDQHRPHNQHLEYQSQIGLRIHGDSPHNHLTDGNFPE